MRLSYLLLSGTFLSLSLLGGCGPTSQTNSPDAEIVSVQSEKLNTWFADRFDDQMARSPMDQTYYGIKDQQSRLDDISELAMNEDIALAESWLAEMQKSFNPEYLDKQSALSYRLFKYNVDDAVANHAFLDHEYVFQHMSGPHSDLPSFLINFHGVKTEKDAEDYIARLTQFETYLGQASDQADKQYQKGVSLPRFVYPKIIGASRNVISGAPFDDGDNSPLWADLQNKVNKLDVSDYKRSALLESGKDALLNSVKPAYENLISLFETHQAGASDDDGAWKLPRGKDYYQARLKHYTTTNMSADEIHQIGLKDVARIHDEMREIMKRVGFEGTLQEFFDHLRTDPKFTYSDDETGRQRYITEATQMIDDMKAELDGLFITKPKADMIVKRVEPFREATAFGAFYDTPALDGSRPGTYYINLKDMGELPIYQMQALAYHEGIPGHHMQLAISQELEGLPKFRTLGGQTAYIEGWALYSEGVPKELGLYTDPYQEFGQLSMEIFRSARLVLDTGIHDQKWTREQAVEYMMANTANSEGDIRAEIDRYIVWPGQATAYKIGMIKIQTLRKDAEDKLGDKFDIREFHDVILANGSVPLTVLEELVEAWVTSKLEAP